MKLKMDMNCRHILSSEDLPQLTVYEGFRGACAGAQLYTRCGTASHWKHWSSKTEHGGTVCQPSHGAPPGASFFVCAVEKFTGACYTYVNRIAKGREQIEGKTSVKLMDGLGYDVR